MPTLPLHHPPESVCLLRLSALGDVTHMLPIVHTLQHHWPDCRLTWIVGALEAQLVQDLPGVEFIVFDKSQAWQSYKTLRQQLRGRRFDVLLHMQAALRASLISMLVNAPIKLGFDWQRARNGQWLFTRQRIEPADNAHVLDGFFGFLAALGIKGRELYWDIPIPDRAYAALHAQLPSSITEQKKRFLVINPSSSLRRYNWRNWPAERYAAIARYAQQRYDLHTVLSGGPAAEEQALGAEICQHTDPAYTHNLIGKTDLKALTALLSSATLVIAPDTGPLHLAAALDIPVIGLYASSNPLRTGPYLSQQWVVNKYPEALRRYTDKTLETAAWGERVRDPDVMDLIEVQEVQWILDKLMQRVYNA